MRPFDRSGDFPCPRPVADKNCEPDGGQCGDRDDRGDHIQQRLDPEDTVHQPLDYAHRFDDLCRAFGVEVAPPQDDGVSPARQAPAGSRTAGSRWRWEQTGSAPRPASGSGCGPTDRADRQRRGGARSCRGAVPGLGEIQNAFKPWQQFLVVGHGQHCGTRLGRLFEEQVEDARLTVGIKVAGGLVRQDQAGSPARGRSRRAAVRTN